MFKDRKSAQTAADILRDFMGINSTTPYHRSLRAAMNKVIAKTKEENPGYQAKTNLDLNGKSLDGLLMGITSRCHMLTWIPPVAMCETL
jgi:hypothetical protein